MRAVLDGPAIRLADDRTRGREFEAAVAAYTGARTRSRVNSGTAALHLSLLAAGVGPGAKWSPRR